MKTLYLCYFGLREPLVQTQVLPYLRQLVASGVQVSLLTFESQLKQQWSSEQIESQRSALAVEGIDWHCLAYHKRPSLLATLFDIAAGAKLASRLAAANPVNVFHSRGHIPMLMGLYARWRHGGKVLFDIRGFMPEEYTDAGLWKENGLLYRGVKGVERFLLNQADAFVVLTEKARSILFPGCSYADQQGRPVEVIPCCVDLERFHKNSHFLREDVRREFGLTDRCVLVYVGALGGFYLTDEMLDFLLTAHRQRPATYSMILTQSSPDKIYQRFQEAGLSPQDFMIRKVSPAEIPRYLKAADIALSFIKPSYSKQASSPTKFAEYLAAGLPVISNAGVGDLDSLIESEKVGALFHEFNAASYLQVLDTVDKLRMASDFASRCQSVAEQYFDLKKVGGARYTRLYGRLEKVQAESALVTESLI